MFVQFYQLKLSEQKQFQFLNNFFLKQVLLNSTFSTWFKINAENNLLNNLPAYWRENSKSSPSSSAYRKCEFSPTNKRLLLTVSLILLYSIESLVYHLYQVISDIINTGLLFYSGHYFINVIIINGIIITITIIMTINTFIDSW